MRIEVRAKVDTDFCKKGDIISMKEGVFNQYHKNSFELVIKNKTNKKKKGKK